MCARLVVLILRENVPVLGHLSADFPTVVNMSLVQVNLIDGVSAIVPFPRLQEHQGSEIRPRLRKDRVPVAFNPTRVIRHKISCCEEELHSTQEKRYHL